MNLVSLAKKAAECFVENGEIIGAPEDFPKELLEKKSGVFVTIEKHGNLRGCIGTYLPARRNIAEEIIYNAVAAAAEDDRFGPITKEELPHLSYAVYILSQPRRVGDVKELNPRKFGAIVRTASKCGLLLPDLEGVETVGQQLNICCRKGGIDPLKEKIIIYSFAAEKYI